ncbi:hypothetical protein A2U01_0035689, partial [Trifolium medium]|nr:hypothetical protein [Trifolium medium]
GGWQVFVFYVSYDDLILNLGSM